MNQPALLETSISKPKRPFALTAVCLLLLLRSLLLLVLGVLLFAGMVTTDSTQLAVFGDALQSILLFGGGLIFFAAALGLWRLDPWAWRLTMILMGIALVFALWSRFSDWAGSGSGLGLLLDIAIVFYLVQGDVRALFAERPSPLNQP